MNLQDKWCDFISLLKTAESTDDLIDKKELMISMIPKLECMIDYNQRNDTHQHDLWIHSLHVVINLPQNTDDDMLYLAALLHDIGKPDCQTYGKKENDKNMHYYGHPKRSVEIIKEEIIPHLLIHKISLREEEQCRLLYYVQHHDDQAIDRTKNIRRNLKIVSIKEFRNLLFLQISDAKAHVYSPIFEQKIKICEELLGEKGTELLKKIKSDI